jgi:hypothetical protein
MFRFAILIPLVLLIATSSRLARQPVTQTLTPPPPSFETCKTVGTGFVCEGARPESYGPIDTGIVCGNGPSAFDIFDQGVFDQHAIRYYDAAGDLTRRVIHEHYTFGQFSNPRTGPTVPYSQSDTITDVLAVAGDLGSATQTETGENIYRPAHGAPVFLNAGRTVFLPDGTLEFRAGPQNFADYFVDGDTSVLDPLCGALSATA